ncbi:MAG: hypothetical protein DRN53_07375 [Thermoprotei archaeon]|nr:MAG: hypothetical protein DRN53_07375 [Thermoprotei archaeon]
MLRYILLAIAIVLIATGASLLVYCPGILFMRYAGYSGVVLEVTEEVAVSVEGPFTAPLGGFTAKGTNASEPVIMSTSAPIATPGVSTGHYYLKVEVRVKPNFTPPNTTYKVELFIGESLIGTVFIASDSDPDEGEYVRVIFDMGSMLSSKSLTIRVIKV